MTDLCASPHPKTAGFGQPIMATPAAYSSSKMVFHDTFAGTSLDLTKWSPGQGANGILWNNLGKLGNDPNGFPYTGPNAPSNTTDSQLYVPTPNAQIVVNNGLMITAQPNTAPLNPGDVSYAYLSGCLTTVTKPGAGPGESANFVLPSTGKWYVQIRAKMPDMNHGIAPCLWFMPGHSGGNSNEIDFIQGGFTEGASAPQNRKPIATGYFGDGSNPAGFSVPDVGFDATTAFHIYGIELNWNTSTITAHADGNVVWTYTIQTPLPQQYEIIINVQCWNPGQGWCTGVNGSSGAYQIAEVQAYTA